MFPDLQGEANDELALHASHLPSPWPEVGRTCGVASGSRVRDGVPTVLLRQAEHGRDLPSPDLL